MDDLPLGFAFALAKNTDAMEYFSALPKQQQEEVVSHTHQIESRQEMHDYVQSLTNKI